MTRQIHPPVRTFRRISVRLLLLAWMVVLVAPCVHCLPIAAAAAAAPAAPAPVVHAATAEMPADCPMHAKAAQQAKAEEPPAAPRAAPGSGPDCPKPSDCCLTDGAAPVAVPEGVQSPPSPSVTTAERPPLVAAPLPEKLLLPRELGNERSHAPPSFLTPLRI